MKGMMLWLLLFYAVAGGTSGGSSGSSSRFSFSTSELRRESEALLTADRGLSQPTLSYQGRTSASATNDNAPGHLISTVPRASMNSETVRLMGRLLDNYEADTTRREVASAAERAEETAFLDALMQTPIMVHLQNYLRQKNVLRASNGLRQVLDDIWFTQYRRGGRHVASSGFEHVFVGELKGGKVSGFHSWLNFKKEEGRGILDYKGYMNTIDLRGKGSIVKARFEWLSQPKPVGSVFLGTTPELEMALYTLCFLAKPNARCPIQLAGHRIQIQTWSFNSRGKKVIGSAYPNI